MNQLKKMHESVASAFLAGLPKYDTLNLSSMLSATSAAQKALESVNSHWFLKDSISERAARGLFDYDLGLAKIADLNMSSAAQKAFESIGSVNAIKDSMAMQKLNHMAWLGDVQRQQEMVESFLKPVKELEAIKESIAAKATAGLGIYEEIQKAMQQHSVMALAQKASLSLTGLTSIQESVGFNASAVQQAMRTVQQMKLFEMPESIASTIEQMQSLGVLSKAIQALNRDDYFAQAVASFNAMASQPELAYAISDAEFSESISFLEATSETEFVKVFPKLHPVIQAVLIFIFKTVLMGIVIGVAGNLVTPYAEKALSSFKLSTDQVRAIKKMPLQDVDTTNLRFVYRNGVKLRAKPSTRSEVLDVLVMGQVVSVLDRKKGWIEVAYSNDEGQICQGWVMSTYTAKFKK